MTTEFKPVAEEPPENPAGMKGFIDETRKLWEEMEKAVAEPPVEAKVAPEPPVEPLEPAIAKPVGEPVAVPETVPEQSGFIKDLTKATPEDFQKRIAYLYAKDKENARQWADARELLRKQREEVESLRSETAKTKIQQTEADLDRIQLQVVDLLDRNSPNYNPAEGARMLRDLTTRDVEAKASREAETKRQEAVKEEIKSAETQRNAAESKIILDTWAESRDYANPGHPMYPTVVEWIKTAYEKAPPEITVQQIVARASQVFDEAAKKPAEKSLAAGANGEKLTVSAVLGTQIGARTTSSAVEQLSPRQRQVAEKLFYNPEGGITKAKAHQMYADGMD